MAYLCVYAALLHDVGSILVDEPQSVEEIERARDEASRTVGKRYFASRGLTEVK